jgi:hypothetical protein
MKKSYVVCRISYIVLAFLALCAVLLTPYAVYAQPIPSSELINNAKAYDGEMIIYSGEVIGDIMVRGDNAWINVHDGQNALGVWVAKDLVKDIFYTAGYKYSGDIVEVKGIFHRACPQHGGDLDIHAVSLKKIIDGHCVKEEENVLKRNLAITLLGALCLVLILRRLKVK